MAAPTTSLPEAPGGMRNWDHRYCWLRDATFTLYALLTGGYTAEADAWRQWLINSVAGTPSTLNIMYGLAGERRLTELTIDWLPGYENLTTGARRECSVSHKSTRRLWRGDGFAPCIATERVTLRRECMACTASHHGLPRNGLAET